jgi:hypothetical protein
MSMLWFRVASTVLNPLNPLNSLNPAVASDIMFTNPYFSRFFTLGQVIETYRGGGIFQPAVDEAVRLLQSGEWVRAAFTLLDVPSHFLPLRHFIMLSTWRG